MGFQEKLPCILRIVNIIASLLIIGFGVAGLIVMAVNDLTDGKFFLFFSPIFMVLIGVVFLVAQFKVQCILRHFQFMRSYLGKGIFYVFMASTVFFYFSCGANNDVVGWIAGALVFALGVFYIVIHFWALKDDQFAATISMDRSAR